MHAKPVIGITAAPVLDPQPSGVFERYRVTVGYVTAVLAAGGLPVVLPPQDGNIAQILDMVDGLLFSGGADLDPALYGDTEVHPDTYEISALRDRFELELLNEAIARDLPVLCICRGIQVLNVALGGSLHQHIPDHVDHSLEHRQSVSGIPVGDPAHQVEVLPDTLAATIFGTRQLNVNSYHHQSIRNLAAGLVLNAVSPDGVVEAVSLPGEPFVFGMQWHPELMFDQHDAQLRPFEAFVSAAANHKLAQVSR